MLTKVLSMIAIGLSGLSIVAVLFGWLMYVIFLDSPKINVPLALLSSTVVALLVAGIPLYAIVTLSSGSPDISTQRKNIALALGLIYPLIGLSVFAGKIILDNRQAAKEETSDIQLFEKNIRGYISSGKILSSEQVHALLLPALSFDDLSISFPAWNEILEKKIIDPNFIIVREYGDSTKQEPILVYTASSFKDKRLSIPLLENGADPNIVDSDGEDALIAFSKSRTKAERNLEVLKKILSCGADINAQDSDGLTALEYLVGEKEKSTDTSSSWFKVLSKEIEIINQFKENPGSAGSCK